MCTSIVKNGNNIKSQKLKESENKMSKRARQYIGLLSAVLAYYIIHEGAHFIYALTIGVFKQINFMGIGMQIDVYNTAMNDMQMGIFCLLGAVATFIVGYALVLPSGKICKVQNKLFKAIMYYITIIMLLLGPLYLSVLCGFFGGGDMNGISLLVPELAARIIFGILLIINGFVFWKAVLPKYTMAFRKGEEHSDD